MSLFAIYASAGCENPTCHAMTDDPDCGPVEALEMTRGTIIGPELTETAYAEVVEP